MLMRSPTTSLDDFTDLYLKLVRVSATGPEQAESTGHRGEEHSCVSQHLTLQAETRASRREDFVRPMRRGAGDGAARAPKVPSHPHPPWPPTRFSYTVPS